MCFLILYFYRYGVQEKFADTKGVVTGGKLRDLKLNTKPYSGQTKNKNHDKKKLYKEK